MRFGIGNRNVSPPYFDKHLYETEVEESVEPQTTVLTVNVHDHNESKCECIVYLFVGHSNDNRR